MLYYGEEWGTLRDVSEDEQDLRRCVCGHYDVEPREQNFNLCYPKFISETGSQRFLEIRAGRFPQLLAQMLPFCRFKTHGDCGDL